MTIIHAVYENGVFRPTEPVNLPPASKVRLEIPPRGGDAQDCPPRRDL